MLDLVGTRLDGRVQIPVFVCTMGFPAIPCPLHVFEPRYHLAIWTTGTVHNKIIIQFCSLLNFKILVYFYYAAQSKNFTYSIYDTNESLFAEFSQGMCLWTLIRKEQIWNEIRTFLLENVKHHNIYFDLGTLVIKFFFFDAFTLNKSRILTHWLPNWLMLGSRDR